MGNVLGAAETTWGASRSWSGSCLGSGMQFPFAQRYAMNDLGKVAFNQLVHEALLHRHEHGTQNTVARDRKHLLLVRGLPYSGAGELANRDRLHF